MLSLSVSGACRQGSNAGELVCGHGVPYCVLDCGIMDRCSLSWGSGRRLLEVYKGWTDAASAGDLEGVY